MQLWNQSCSFVSLWAPKWNPSLYVVFLEAHGNKIMRSATRKLLAIKVHSIHGIIIWEVHKFQIICSETIRNWCAHTAWRPWTNAKSFNSCYFLVATSYWHLVWALKMASPIDKPSYNSEYPDPEGSIKECAIILPLCHFVNVSLNNDCYLASNAVYPEVCSPLSLCLPRRVQAQLWNPSPRRTFVLLLMWYCTKLYISSCDTLSDEELPCQTFRYPQPIPKPILIMVKHFHWVSLRT